MSYKLRVMSGQPALTRPSFPQSLAAQNSQLITHNSQLS